ncbi:uncharacterized protein TNCT_202391 [Trichonephila clavata]|uniref:Uncharacterized protein n=1 Tax=Trichonephila clavata TaxID=2740835 RepID=A0A8X6GYS4_TRICU|nr:uncharacterized protein TNCT_202391 [Trichonephila clavata]
MKWARQVHSYSQDVIFAVHNGHVKTPKHIMLGMTFQSLTSSKKIIDIINRYDPCISYQGIEELDVRSTIISEVYLELGLQTHQDVLTDFNLHNIRKNTKQLRQFIATFDRFINPFSSEVPKDQLINISSGKSASPPVEAFLLNIEKNGDYHRKTFFSECLSDINRFEKAIKNFH